MARFATKNGLKLKINQKKLTTLTKILELKHQCYDQIYVDYSDVYIVVKGNIILTNPDGAKRKKSAAFKNNAPFINCISKINDVQIDNAEVLDVVMLIYNLLEYSKNYRKTTGNLGNCYRDEPIDLLFLILNLLNTRQVLQEILTLLVLMKLIVMQTKLVKMKLKLL